MSFKKGRETSASALKNTLVDMLEDGNRKLNVSKLCEHSEIARATFYLHFKSIDDVFVAIIDDIFDELEQHVQLLDESKDPTALTRTQLVVTYEYRHVLLALFELGKLDAIARRARKATREFLFRTYPNLQAVAGNDRFEDALSFLVGGTSLLMETWLRDPAPDGVRERHVQQITDMTQLLFQYAVEGQDVEGLKLITTPSSAN